MKILLKDLPPLAILRGVEDALWMVLEVSVEAGVVYTVLMKPSGQVIQREFFVEHHADLVC